MLTTLLPVNHTLLPPVTSLVLSQGEILSTYLVTFLFPTKSWSRLVPALVLKLGQPPLLCPGR
jgi:hypothetical protein